MLKKILFIVLVVCTSSNLYAEDKKEPSIKLDPVCRKEMNDSINKVKKDPKYKECTNSVIKNIEHKFTTECHKEFESKKRMDTVACQQESANINIAASMELQNCAQMLSPVSLECTKQFKLVLSFLQDRVKICADAFQKVIQICGTDLKANKKCYEEQRASLPATCK